MSIYDKDGGPLTNAYDKDGMAVRILYDVDANIVFSGVDYSSYTKETYLDATVSPMQGFDIHSGTIFQMLASSSVSNKMITIDTATGTASAQIAISSDHGDSASFSDEYYIMSDAFPMLYVTADTNPAKVYVNRVTKTSATLIRTLSFPIEKAGYYAALCLDAENDLAYMVGYSEQNYQTDDGGSNKVVISKWNLASLSANGDSTYTPAFISSVERPFIYVMQGQQFHDGMLWIASGGTGTNGYVYALAPSSGTLAFTVDTQSTVEIEGLAFIDMNKMVVGHQGGHYDLYTFEQEAI